METRPPIPFAVPLAEPKEFCPRSFAALHPEMIRVGYVLVLPAKLITNANPTGLYLSFLLMMTAALSEFRYG